MDSNTGYLLILFNQDTEKHPGNAMRKYVSKAEFKILQEDSFSTVELIGIPYTITDRCFFHLSQLQNTTMIGVITVKKIEV